MPKIRISLEGSEQVIAQLRALGLAGEQSVRRIQTAAAGGFAGDTRSIAAAGKAAEEAGKGFAIGRREIVGFSKALKEVGAGPVASQLSALAAITSRLGAFGLVAAGITAVGAAATAAGAGMFRFSKSAADTAQVLGELSAVTGTSVESLSTLANVFAQGGTPLAKFAQEFGGLAEKVRVAREQLDAKAAGPEATEWANSLDNVARKFKALSEGIQTSFDPLTTLETKAKAVIQLLADRPLGAFGARLATSADQAEKDFQKLADIFKNLSSDMERAQLGKALELSPSTIATLSLGSAAIKKLQADVRELGLSLNDVDKQNLSGLQRAMNTVSALWDALTNKIGALAAPAFTSFFQGFGEQLRALAPVFTQLGTAFGQIDFTAVGRGAADLAVQLGQAALAVARFFEALAKGDTQTVKAQLDQLSAALAGLAGTLTPAATLLGKALGTAIVIGIKDAIQIQKGSIADRLMQALSTAPAETQAAPAAPAGPGFFQRLLDALTPAKAQAAEAGVQIGQSLAQGVQGGVNQASLAVSNLGSNLTTFAQQAASGFNQAWQALQQGAGTAGSAAANALTSASSAAQNLNQSLSQTGQAAASAVPAIGGIEQSLWRAAAAGAGLEAALWKVAAAGKGIEAQMWKGPGGGGGGGERAIWGGMAGGGLMGGRGTGTSDSNLAWLSRGEHIMPARAVRQPGVLAFLEMLRRSGGNLRGVLDGMGRFARGGLVLPAFAAGGPVGGMSNVTIQFPGLQPISGLRASASVVDELHRAAALAQVRSGGRKPSRYS